MTRTPCPVCGRLIAPAWGKPATHLTPTKQRQPGGSKWCAGNRKPEKT